MKTTLKYIGRLLLLIVIMMSGASPLSGQANFSVIPVEVDRDITEEAAKVIFRKTEQILTRNSAAAAGVADVFAVQAKLTVTGKSATSGLVRNISSLTGELTLVALNKIDNAKYYSVTVSLEAAAKSGGESAAVLALANSIKTNDAVYTRFVRVAREKVEEYYTDHCQEVLERAKSLALSGQYAFAMVYLTGMPSSAPCHGEALAIIDGLRGKLDNDRAEAEAKREAREERRREERERDRAERLNGHGSGYHSYYPSGDDGLGELYVEDPFWKFRIESAEYLATSRKVKITAYITYVGNKPSGTCRLGFRSAVDADGKSFDTCYVEGDVYRDFPDDVPVKVVYYIDNVKQSPEALGFVGLSVDGKKIEIRNLPVYE